MLSVLGWAALGFAGGVLGHYVLYRVGLPLQPFIYVSF
jgi:hypothetical protein